MEDLKRQRANASASGPQASTPTDLSARPVGGAASPPVLIPSGESVRDQSEVGGSPFYAKAWFWVAVGAVAAGTVVAALLLRGDDKQPLDTLDLTGQTPMP